MVTAVVVVVSRLSSALSPSVMVVAMIPCVVVVIVFVRGPFHARNAHVGINTAEKIEREGGQRTRGENDQQNTRKTGEPDARETQLSTDGEGPPQAAPNIREPRWVGEEGP